MAFLLLTFVCGLQLWFAISTSATNNVHVPAASPPVGPFNLTVTFKSYKDEMNVAKWIKDGSKRRINIVPFFAEDLNLPSEAYDCDKHIKSRCGPFLWFFLRIGFAER